MSIPITLRVKHKIIETEDAATLVFEYNFDYKPGQFLTLILNIEGKEQRRSYSLSSSPLTGELPSITVKKIEQGTVSKYLVDQIEVGDKIEALSPTGLFILDTNQSLPNNIVLIAAGSGISPVMSILKSALFSDALVNVLLIYGNRNENSVILLHELEKLSIQYENRLKIHYQYSQPLHYRKNSGRLDQEIILDVLRKCGIEKETNSLYYICGPQGMMLQAQQTLKNLGVGDKYVFRENYHSDKLASMEYRPVEISLDNNSEVVSRTVVVKYLKEEHEFEVPFNKTILQAALDLDIKLPYSCQNGMCTACIGMCVSGKVKLIDPEGLSSNELKKGYVLTCVAQPLSEGVIIEI